MSNQCNDRQSCCLCCQIGKRAFEDHGTCDPNIMLPEPCKSSYLACCEERILNQVNPIIPIPSKPTTPPPTTKRTTTTTTSTTVYIPTTRKRSVCEQFGNTLCDHICVDNPEKFGKTFWCECRDGFERIDEKCVPIKTRVCIEYNLIMKISHGIDPKILFWQWCRGYSTWVFCIKVTCEMLNCGKFSNGHPFCHASPDGDAKCECLPGYKKINDNSCIDIDECDHPDPYRNDS